MVNVGFVFIRGHDELLVATGQVRPDQVLGLTFTTKAASQLRAKVREALLAAGLLDEPEPRASPAR